MRRNILIALFCDADERRRNEALCGLAELTPVDMLSALAEVEYQNDWAEGVKQLFDSTTRERLRAQRRRIIAIGRSVNGGAFMVTAPVAPVSDPAVEKWIADGAPTCGSRWTGDYSNVEPAESRPGYIGD